MMGDAGDETLQLIRFFDTEQFDLTKLQQDLVDYHTRLRALFCDGLCLETGLTKTMLETLRSRPMIVKLRGGAVKQLGGKANGEKIAHYALKQRWPCLFLSPGLAQAPL